MSTDSFDLFCMNCNILVSAQVVACGNGGFSTKTLTDPDDGEYHGDVYSVALCGRCSAPFLVCQSLYGVPGDFETVVNERLLYPTPSRLPVDQVPPVVGRAYEQAHRSFISGLYEPCSLMCRKTLEALAKHLGATGATLAARLTSLHTAGKIERRLLDWAHEVRLVGNDAAHDVDVEISKDDARDALDLTEAILIYLFALNERFDRFRARRRAPPPTT